MWVVSGGFSQFQRISESFQEFHRYSRGIKVVSGGFEGFSEASEAFQKDFCGLKVIQRI